VYSSVCYEEFNPFYDYSVKSSSIEKYNLSKEEWELLVARYEEQDKKVKHDISNNVKRSDYPLFKDFFTKCHMCNDKIKKPTLDKIDNLKPHTIGNVKPCCLYCNCYKSEKDEHTAKLFIQLRKFAELKHLPMLLAKCMENLYRLTREWITGGLSNVLNRFNIRNLNSIKKLLYDKESISIIEGKIITHNICLDANSQYPSSFVSVKFPWNRYTGGIMYTACPLKEIIKDKNEAMKIIKEQKEIFVCKLKGHIPEEFYNTPLDGAPSKYANVLNFPPIIRNINITTSKEVTGETMYDFMKSQETPVDKKERKLT
jgi:hypothetical protein